VYFKIRKREFEISMVAATSNKINLPLPRSSGSAWTTTALPTIEFGPLRGICKGIRTKHLDKCCLLKKVLREWI